MNAPTLNFNHHPHDDFWLLDQFNKLPNGIHATVQRNYAGMYAGHGRQSANNYILDVLELAAGKPLLVKDDMTIKHKAERMARIGRGISLDKARALLLGEGLPFPLGATEETALARLACPVWWYRQLMRKQDREQELLSVQIGAVCKGRMPYVSDALFTRIQSRHQQGMEALAGFEAVSDDGDTLNMRDVLEKSVANPAIRRAELMVRMRGFEDYAKTQGHVALFYTVTCPSKYHRHSGSVLNPKYMHASPRQAQAYLVRLWGRARAKLKRDGINPYGFRVAEPHHDGTPHWHILLFVPVHQADHLTAVLKDYAYREDGTEMGASQHRFEVVQIDTSKGSATGYIAKYISKNIDGFGMETELDGETGASVASGAARVRAWSSAWGIRQFQQIGGAPVGVWRELRRMDKEVKAVNDLLEMARLAADGGDWARYLELQGGANLDRKDQPLKVWSVEKVDMDTGAIKTSRYGETGKQPKGILLEGEPVAVTRTKQWTIQKITAANDASSTGMNAAFTGMNAAFTGIESPTRFDFLQAASLSYLPWSTVNNCTQVQISDAERDLIRASYRQKWAENEPEKIGKRQTSPRPKEEYVCFEEYLFAKAGLIAEAEGMAA